jgi:hypothetical protein
MWVTVRLVLPDEVRITAIPFACSDPMSRSNESRRTLRIGPVIKNGPYRLTKKFHRQCHSIDTQIVIFETVIPRVENPSSPLIFVQPNERREILAEWLSHD